MFKIIILITTVTILMIQASPLKQTGNTKSYDEFGNEVARCSIKDDGCYRAGIAPNYTRSNGVVTDAITGLQWQDNETVIKPWIISGNTYNDTSGDTATTYCSTLSLDGNGVWRLPDVKELETLLEYNQVISIDENIFEHTSQFRAYATSRSNSSDEEKVMVIWFYGASVVSHDKVDSYNVRCVRGEEFAPLILTRNDNENIVSDANTNLQWQDNEGVQKIQRSWKEALGYCENLEPNALDWRLPNIRELQSIVNYATSDPAISSYAFHHVTPRSYWSSNSKIDNQYASTVHFGIGKVANSYKLNDTSYTRCVRGGTYEVYEAPTVYPAIIHYLLY